VIAKEKYKIIQKEGSPVTVDGSATKALIGRGSSHTSSIISVEAVRKGYFFPDAEVGNGSIVTNEITDETYLVVATYPEEYSGKVLSINTSMYVCNATVDIQSVITEYDENGDKTTKPNDVLSDGPCYLQRVSAELKQYDSGIHPDAQYIIFVTACEAGLMDTIAVKNHEPPLQFKAVDINNFIFEGITRIQVKAETRDA
jgi:hypothetical protein